MTRSRLLLVFVISLVLAICGCGSDSDTSDGDVPDGDKLENDDEENSGQGDIDYGDSPEADNEEGDGDLEVPVDGDLDSDALDRDVEIVEQVNPIETYVQDVDQTAFVSDLTFIAKERTPGSDHWKAVQDMCYSRLTDLGYDVERHVYATGVNVIGRKQGTAPDGGDVILSAHYDHISGCAGADDNASGLASLFEAARILANSKFKNNLVLACWDEEERGLVGSRAYVDRAESNGDLIITSLVFDTIAYTDSAPNSQTLPMGFDLFFPDMAKWLTERESRGDFIVILSVEDTRDSSHSLEYWAEFVSLPMFVLELDDTQKNSDLFGDLRRSDHAAFWLKDYPALMITDTANFRNPYYHCLAGQDTIDTIDIPFVIKVTQATIGSVADSLEPVEE